MEQLQIWVRNLETKKEIRKKISRLRQELDPLIWQQKTESIASAVISHPWFRETTDIYSYVDCHGETGTTKIIEEAWRLGKNVWVPKVIGAEMIFCHISSIQELRPGAYGILEPETDWISEGTEGLMIIPGVAFDSSFHRIGYGGGYYDRYLAAHPRLRTMAIAFDFQIFQQIPHETHDIQPGVLITETKICQREYYEE